jgi:hypothetical protein
VHPSGLPIQLRDSLLQLDPADPLLGQLWARRRAPPALQPIQTLSPEDHLLHVCAHAAAHESRRTLRWVCDAWFIIERSAELRWTVLLESAHLGGLSLPLYVALRYLSAELGAGVPGQVLETLRRDAVGVSSLARETALAGARRGPRGRFRDLFRASPTWRSRAVLARWVLLPSPSYLRRASPLSPRLPLPLYYLYRPLRYCLLRAASCGRFADWTRRIVGPGQS